MNLKNRTAILLLLAGRALPAAVDDPDSGDGVQAADFTRLTAAGRKK